MSVEPPVSHRQESGRRLLREQTLVQSTVLREMLNTDTNEEGLG
jgi:hypothetical protein